MGIVGKKLIWVMLCLRLTFNFKPGSRDVTSIGHIHNYNEFSTSLLS